MYFKLSAKAIKTSSSSSSNSIKKYYYDLIKLNLKPFKKGNNSFFVLS